MGGLEKKLSNLAINPLGFQSQRKSGRLLFDAGDRFLECQPPSMRSFRRSLGDPIVDLLNVEFCPRKDSNVVRHVRLNPVSLAEVCRKVFNRSTGFAFVHIAQCSTYRKDVPLKLHLRRVAGAPFQVNVVECLIASAVS
jgi:hypothetical protein